jgi:hypothetical protein
MVLSAAGAKVGEQSDASRRSCACLERAPADVLYREHLVFAGCEGRGAGLTGLGVGMGKALQAKNSINPTNQT